MTLARSLVVLALLASVESGCTRAGFGASGAEAGQPRDHSVADRRLDRLGDLLRLPDRRADGNACVMAPTYPQGYVKPCPGATALCPESNSDCDALPAQRDPYADCNELLYEQRFETDLLATSAWKGMGGGAWSWSCGKLSQTSTANLYTSALALDAAPATSDYLVEARVTLGPKGAGSPHWRVGVLARASTPAPGSFYFIGCSIWENPNTAVNPVVSPGLLVTLRNAATETAFEGEMNAWPYPHKKVPGLEAVTGSTYTLQLWYTPNATTSLQSPYPACATVPSCPAVLCRVCDEVTCFHLGAYVIYADLSHLTFLPKTPGTVGVRTLNRAATFNSIRVHELKKP